jgi:hypothetical protein
MSTTPFRIIVVGTSHLHSLRPVTPNQTGTVDGRNNYFYNPASKEKTWDHLGRIDQNFSQNHRAFIRFHKDFWEENKNHTFPNTPAAGIILNRRNEGVAFDNVYVFIPTFLFNFRYGVEFGDFLEQRNSRGFDLSSLGFTPDRTEIWSPRVGPTLTNC